MAEASIKIFTDLFNPVRLMGPIFDKELRVSSRRRRNYFLRFVYVVLLTIFVATAWAAVVKFEGTSLFQKSRMAVAGKTIITTIVTFQFIATQCIAIIMLSNSISDEIYHRTLGVLMTTPISSFQIVMGKLFSKLLQIILLLAISLPLLAVVRIFGGVPLEYVLSSLCITLTAVIFAGSLSLNFSIGNRRSYVVIIKTAVTICIFFIFIPILLTALLAPRWIGSIGFLSPVSSFPIWGPILLHLNPFTAMSVNTAMMVSPTTVGGLFFYWPVHCVLMLTASAFLITRAVKVVRKVALRQAVGAVELIPKHRLRKSRTSLLTNRISDNTGIIREIKGSPVLWKERRAPLIQGGEGRNSIIGLVITIIVLLITYGICAVQGVLDEDFTHVSYTLMFIIIGSIFTIVPSATCITSEKESSAWPILMVTSLSEWQIIIGKALGVFYRCLPVWLLLAGHIIIFILVGYIHPIAIVHLTILIMGLTAFLIGLGLYCSSRFKRTTSAVVADFIFNGVFWAVIPIVLELEQAIFHRVDIFNFFTSANPLIQASVIMSGAGGRANARSALSSLEYNWPSGGLDSTTGFVIVVMMVYICLGLLFAWRAKRRLRRGIF